MKKILTALAALAVVATPVAAEARHRDRGDEVGNFIGGLIVGAVVGAAISSADRDRQDDTYNEPRYRDRDSYRPRRVCFKEQTVEYRFGRKYVYYEYRCR
jgi:Ni/Co efflux regulator RcnB